MDPHHSLASPQYGERPIILSPPPLDQQPLNGFPGSVGANVGPSAAVGANAAPNAGAGISVQPQDRVQSQDPIQGQPTSLANPHLLKSSQVPQPSYHTGRQQSVGYNLQHEFETLTADLDLDLRHNMSNNSSNKSNLSISKNAPSESTHNIQNKTPSSSASASHFGGGPTSLGANNTGGMAATSITSPKFDSPTNQGALSNKSASSLGANGSGISAPVGHGHGLLAPSASKYGFLDLNAAMSPISTNFLHDQSVSPIPTLNSNGLATGVSGATPTSTNPAAASGLGCLLNNSSSANTLSTGSAGGVNGQAGAGIGASTSSASNIGGSFLPPLGNLPNRPQSVNDFSNFFGRQQQHQLALEQQEQRASNFYSDLLVFTHWVENLNPQDIITMIEYFCNNLPLDILLTFKSKLESHLTHQHNPPSAQQPQAQSQSIPSNFARITSPFQPQQLNDYIPDMESLSLEPNFNDTLHQSQSQSQVPQPHHQHQGQTQHQSRQPQQSGLYQPKPKQNTFRSHLFADAKAQRPKSADPSLNTRYASMQQQQQQHQGKLQMQPSHHQPASSNLSQGSTLASDQQHQQHLAQQFERARSPTSHLYEKTNFLQLAAANSNSPSGGQHYSHNYNNNNHHLQHGNASNHNHQQQYAGSGANLAGSGSPPPSATSATTQPATPHGHNPGHQVNAQSSNSDESLDLSAHAALKLGALTTINSRVALDSSRKNHGGSFYGQQQQSQSQHHQQNQQQPGPQGNQSYHQQQPSSVHHYHGQSGAGRHMGIAAYEESLNRSINSSSVPVGGHRYQQPASPSMHKDFKPKQQMHDSQSHSRSPQSQSSQSQLLGSSNSSMPAEISHPDLLNNIPAWLKLLRLHKYTECLKDTYWKDLIELSDEQLEDKGVKALGARRKLLKAFDAVKSSNQVRETE